MNNLIKPAKIVLAKKYGYKNVSVKNGQGTAWGWVDATITVPAQECFNKNTPMECKRGERCYKCKEAQRTIHNKAKELIYKAWKQEGLKPYTYTQDEGHSDSACLLVQVKYA